MKITRTKLIALVRTIGEQYAAELDALSAKRRGKTGLSPKQIGDMAAGHTDGMRNMMTALRAQGIIEVVDAPEIDVCPGTVSG